MNAYLTMLLSVITINRNNASGLLRTIKSVLDQKEKRFEYIIVDGASTDGSVSIIKSQVESAIIPVKWISECDNGVYSAMNKGIRMAEGEYVIFMNSGDVFASDEILSLFVSMEHNADIFFGYVTESQTNEIIKFPYQKMNVWTVFSHNIPHQAEFIRRDLFIQFGLYSEDLLALSDFEFNLKMAIHEVRFINICRMIAIVEPCGISQNTNVIIPELAKFRNRLLPPVLIKFIKFVANNEKILVILNSWSVVSKCVRLVIKCYAK